MRARIATVLVVLPACGRTPIFTPPLARACALPAHATEWLAYDPDFGGGPGPTLESFTDPQAAVGAPDYTGGGRGMGAVSLGAGGLLELGFDGCLASNSGDGRADLRVHEVGPNVERMSIALVATAETAALLGDADDDAPYPVGVVEGSVRDLDVDAALPGFERHALSFTAIVLVDDAPQGWTDGERAGADIDAVELLSAVRPGD